MRRIDKEFWGLVVAPVGAVVGLCGLLIWYLTTYCIVTDNQTGCQYLKTEYGITPRIGPDGKTHLGCGGLASAP